MSELHFYAANLGGTTEAVFRPIGLKAAIFILQKKIKKGEQYGIFNTLQNKAYERIFRG